jgi:hypothetical protein
MLLLIAIASFVLTAFLGARLAQLAGFPAWVGAVVGLVFHLPGLAVLAVIDLVGYAEE